jgi:hypothetical protein
MVDSATKRVTVNVPARLLDHAQQVSGRGITDTIIAGLELVARRRAYDKALALKGKLRLDIDVDASRERSRR